MVINKLKCFKGMGCGTSKLSTSGPEVIEVKPRTQTQDAVYEYDIEDMKDGKVGVAQSGNTKFSEMKNAASSEGSSTSKVDEYTEYLRGFYDINTKTLAYSKWPPIRTTQFVDLALAEIVSNDVEQRNKEESLRLGTLKHAKKRANVTIDQVVKMGNGQHYQCVVLEGAPGIGKSTLAWQIGKRWFERSMFHDHRIFVILKLRDRSVRDAKQVADLFRHPDPHVTKAVVDWLVSVGGRGCVLILDGFDEQIVDLQSKSLIGKIIRGKELPAATLFITARTSASHALLQLRESCGFQDQLIEVMGFRKREVDAYVDRSLRSNATLLDSFRRYIGCHPHIYSLMSVPMNCAIVVEMYRNHNSVGKPIPRTITELYVAFTRVLLALHEKDEAEQVDTSLSFESQTLQIHHDELLGAIQDPVGLSRLLCTNGVLTQPVFGDMDQISTKEKNSLILNAVEARVINVPQVYHVFIDMLRKDSALRTSSVTRMTNTFKQVQEGTLVVTPPKWTCFEGLSSTTLSKLAGIARLAYESTMRSETVLCDLPERIQTLGLLQTTPDQLMDSSSYSFLHPTLQEFLTAYHIMSLSISQQKEFINRSAVKSNMALTVRFTAGLTKYQPTSEGVDSFADVFTPGRKENINLVENLHWLFETQRPAYIRAVMGSNAQTFHCEDVSLNPFDLYALGYCIAHSATLWSIRLQQCSITDEHIRMLVLAEKGRAFHHITSFSSILCDLVASGIVLLEPALKNNTCLTTLDLGYNCIESEGAAAVAKALAHNTLLLELGLSHCGLDDEAISRLNIGLSCCKLQKLDLSGNPFTKKGALELSLVMKSHPTVKELNVLRCDDINVDGAGALLEAVRSNTTLRMLRLDERYRHLVQMPLTSRVKFD